MMAWAEPLLAALALQAGYNTALVAVGAALLGVSAGSIGTFVFLRKRALVSDAVSHATLPGLAIAFIVMAALGGDGRFLPGLLAGGALSAWIGLVGVEWMTRRTRLSEDAAIGAVLSVFFGFGIVLLTVIQNLPFGRQAGLDNFLLGSTAGMLFSEAVTIAVAGAVSAVLVFVLRRPMTLVAFDPGYAATSGIDVRRTDLAMMALALLAAVVGLKVVGLILIVALMIIPPVAGRFWTDRADRLILISGGIGGVSGYAGAAISSVADQLPTGPIIVLVAFGIFAVSIVFSPVRGLLASALRFRAFQVRVHERQGLLALARGEAIHDRLTLAVLKRRGYLRGDGVATLAGRQAAADVLRDEARWAVARRLYDEDVVTGGADGLTPIGELLAPDQVAALDSRIAMDAEVRP